MPPVDTFCDTIVKRLEGLGGGGGGGFCFAVNVAVTVWSWSTVTVQPAVPEQAPLQPAKVDPATGDGVSDTDVPAG